MTDRLWVFLSLKYIWSTLIFYVKSVKLYLLTICPVLLRILIVYDDMPSSLYSDHANYHIAPNASTIVDQMAISSTQKWLKNCPLKITDRKTNHLLPQR